jgi:uncharacterized protein YcbK (DUF882 family)
MKPDLNVFRERQWGHFCLNFLMFQTHTGSLLAKTIIGSAIRPISTSGKFSRSSNLNGVSEKSIHVCGQACETCKARGVN